MTEDIPRPESALVTVHSFPALYCIQEGVFMHTYKSLFQIIAEESSVQVEG